MWCSTCAGRRAPAACLDNQTYEQPLPLRTWPPFRVVWNGTGAGNRPLVGGGGRVGGWFESRGLVSGRVTLSAQTIDWVQCFARKRSNTTSNSHQSKVKPPSVTWLSPFLDWPKSLGKASVGKTGPVVVLPDQCVIFASGSLHPPQLGRKASLRYVDSSCCKGNSEFAKAGSGTTDRWRFCRICWVGASFSQ